MYTALQNDHVPWGSLSTAVLLTEPGLPRVARCPDQRPLAPLHCCLWGPPAQSVGQRLRAQAHTPSVPNQSDRAPGPLRTLGNMGKTTTYSPESGRGLVDSEITGAALTSFCCLSLQKLIAQRSSPPLLIPSTWEAF